MNCKPDRVRYRSCSVACWADLKICAQFSALSALGSEKFWAVKQFAQLLPSSRKDWRKINVRSWISWNIFLFCASFKLGYTYSVENISQFLLEIFQPVLRYVPNFLKTKKKNLCTTRTDKDTVPGAAVFLDSTHPSCKVWTENILMLLAWFTIQSLNQPFHFTDAFMAARVHCSSANSIHLLYTLCTALAHLFLSE